MNLGPSSPKFYDERGILSMRWGNHKVRRTQPPCSSSRRCNWRRITTATGGFTVSIYEADPALYGSAERDNCHVHFAHYDGANAQPNSVVVPPEMSDADFWPDDVDALHAEFEGRGATIIQPPTNQPYGLREFHVQDPDGHILAFGKGNA